MKVSIFTPSHNTAFLLDAYNSIKDQPFDEWVILLNGGAKPREDMPDKRIKYIFTSNRSGYVGFYKKIACEMASGDILIELDHDDMLLPDAVKEVKKAFQDKKVGFVYSNSVACNMDWEITEHYDAPYWIYRPFMYQGHKLEECVAFDPTPENVSRIWCAPNHLRAFRKSVYDDIGGHSEDMRVLDDQDIMSRMYKVTKFYHIDKPLYLYRVHGENSWLKHNKEIQNNVYRIYEMHIQDMACKWARDNSLMTVDLGGRFNKPEGFVSVDKKDADICGDLEKEWPLKSGSVGVVRAHDIFEHLKDPIHTMKELDRVLAPGGLAFIQVPSTDGRGAFQDPTHVSFWNQNSFLYYTNEQTAKFIDRPVMFHRLMNYTTAKNDMGVCWVVAHLMKVTDGMRVWGLVGC